jgi:hypothetical protein
LSLIFYEAIQESQLDRQAGEQGELALWQRPPLVDDEVLMGSDRRWRVVKVEAYHMGIDIDTVYVAMVNRANLIVPEQWRSHQRRELFPNVTLGIYVAPSKAVLACQMSMEGTSEAIGFQLQDYVSAGQSTRMASQPRPWKVDHIQTYLSTDDETSYSAIHLGWCKEVALELAA